jgi:hypothetical protein
MGSLKMVSINFTEDDVATLQPETKVLISSFDYCNRISMAQSDPIKWYKF